MVKMFTDVVKIGIVGTGINNSTGFRLQKVRWMDRIPAGDVEGKLHLSFASER